MKKNTFLVVYSTFWQFDEKTWTFLFMYLSFGLEEEEIELWCILYNFWNQRECSNFYVISGRI